MNSARPSSELGSSDSETSQKAAHFARCWRLALPRIWDLDGARRGQQIAITGCGWRRTGEGIESARSAPRVGAELVGRPLSQKVAGSRRAADALIV